MSLSLFGRIVLSAAADFYVGLPLHNVFREDVFCRAIHIHAKDFGIDANLALGDHRELLAGHKALHAGMRRSSRDHHLEIRRSFRRERVAGFRFPAFR